VQVCATPIEGILKDFMEFGETGLADHEQSTPHQRAHAAERDAQLINRNGRSRRFSHASILPKTYRVRSLTPKISRSPSLPLALK